MLSVCIVLPLAAAACLCWCWLAQVLKGKVEARAKQRGPFEDSAEAEQQQALSAPSSPRSKAGRPQGACDMSRAGTMGGDGCSRKRRSGSISSDEDHATGHSDNSDEEGGEDETGEDEEEQEEEEEETVAGIPIRHLRDLFNSIDVDGSGEIDAEELHGALRKMGMRKSPAEVQELLLMADPDGSGEARRRTPQLWAGRGNRQPSCSQHRSSLNVSVHAWSCGRFMCQSLMHHTHMPVSRQQLAHKGSDP